MPPKKTILRKNPVEKNLDFILEVLSNQGTVFSRVSLIQVLTTLKAEGVIRYTFGYERFLNALIELEVLEKVKFTLPNHSITSRFVLIKGEHTAVHPFEIALSLLPNSYLSHYSALFLNDLTNNIPK